MPEIRQEIIYFFILISSFAFIFSLLDDVPENNDLLTREAFGEIIFHNDTNPLIVNLNITNQFLRVYGLNSSGHYKNIYTNDTLVIIQDKGYYLLAFDVSYKGQSNHEYQWTVFINGIEDLHCEVHQRFSGTNTFANAGFTCIDPLNIGDNITLYAKDVIGTSILEITSISFNLHKVGD